MKHRLVWRRLYVAVTVLPFVQFAIAPVALQARTISIRDKDWAATRRLGEIFEVPWAALPEVSFLDFQDLTVEQGRSFSQDESTAVGISDALADIHLYWSHGYFDRGRTLLKSLVDRHKSLLYTQLRSSHYAGRAGGQFGEPVYVLWPDYYVTLYAKIAKDLGPNYQHFVWPPVLQDRVVDGQRQTLLVVESIDGGSPQEPFAEADPDVRLFRYRVRKHQHMLIFDEASRRLRDAGEVLQGPASEFYPASKIATRSMSVFRTADFQGRGREASLLEVNSGPYESVLLIVNRDEIEFQKLAESNWQLIFASDLTGDFLPDMVMREDHQGVHTHSATFLILSGHKDRWRASVAIDATSPREVTLSEGTAPNLVISGGLIGSAGAGVQRERTDVYGWDGDAFVLKEVLWERTEWRHHALYNANDEFSKGHLDEARRLYLQVLEDGPFRDDLSWGDSKAACKQFAAFRLLLLAVEEHAKDRAEGLAELLRREYPGSLVTAAGALVLGEARDTANWKSACPDVERLLRQGEKPLGALENMGYGNPKLAPVDLCPEGPNQAL